MHQINVPHQESYVIGVSQRCINSTCLLLQKIQPYSSASQCQDVSLSQVCLHMTRMLDLCMLGSRIKAFSIEVMFLPTTVWLLCWRHPIKVLSIPMSLCPWVAPHEGTECVLSFACYHANMLVCCCYPCVLAASIPF